MAREVPIAIVGSGFAGLGAAIRLQQAGRRDFVILEQGSKVGGTWRDNTYPGCACDVPSHLYSFSFALNPEWSRTFAPQAEIQAYLQRQVAAHGLGDRLFFGAALREARYDEDRRRWQLRFDGAEPLAARTLILGVGALSRPAIPELPGLARFQGRSFHSARWPAALDLAGRRVAVIGTGASAVQLVPAIAPEVKALHLFQRTPPWVLPRPDRPIGRRRRRTLAALPWALRLRRWWAWLWMEARGVGFTVHPAMQRLAAFLGKAHLRSQVRDPALRARLTPHYLPGCKRLLMSNDYYPALQLPQVELVDTPIAEITERGLRTEDGRERAVEVLVLATGFRVAERLAPVRLTGKGGVELGDLWKDHPRAHLGTTVAGFPNLFVLTGPNTGLGHNSMVFMIESQLRLVLALLAARDSAGAAAIEVREAAQTAFNEGLRSRLKRSVWASGCHSWYFDQSGELAALWPGSTAEFWWRTRRAKLADYRLSPPD